MLILQFFVQKDYKNGLEAVNGSLVIESTALASEDGDSLELTTVEVGNPFWMDNVGRAFHFSIGGITTRLASSNPNGLELTRLLVPALEVGAKIIVGTENLVASIHTAQSVTVEIKLFQRARDLKPLWIVL